MNIRFYHAKILLTKADHTFEVTEGELWVRGDHICYIGDGTDTSAVCKEDDIIIWDREIDAKGNLLMPGFKNAHTHTPMTFLRSFADDLPLQEWLQQKVFPNEARLKGEDTYWLAILGIMEYLTSGITSNFDMYIMQDYHINAYVDTGFRTVFTSGLNNFTDSLEVLEENYLRINGLSDLTSYVPGFHAEYTTSRPLLEGVAKIADKYHAPVWTHNSETEREVAECKARWGMTPMQFTESLGLYEHGGGGYHCVWLEEKDIEILKKHHMSVVTNPGSNTKLASGICPVKRLLDEGINVISAINIQHIESVNEEVQEITGIEVKERVPDSVLQEADEVVNIDLTAEELIARLKAGKIYRPEKIQTALDNFFRTENILQLRELALKEVALRVEKKVENEVMMGVAVGLRHEKFMACISSHEKTPRRIIRKAAKLATRYNTTFIALYVQTPRESMDRIDLASQRYLLNHFKLVAELGEKLSRYSRKTFWGASSRL